MSRSRWVATLIPLLLVAGAAAEDWPHLRGPQFDGVAPEGARGDATLETLWSVTLGSGYSGIVVVEEHVVVAFTDGVDDLAAAFDASTGRELWRYRVDRMNAGRNGSHDGPISTPTVYDGKVFVLGPNGQLNALRLADGELLWSLSLSLDFGAAEPDFGFGTTPLVVHDVLVVLAGGDAGRSVVGLSPDTGELLWSHGVGDVEYQSPIPVRVGGRSHLVAVVGNEVFGLDPRSGGLLWAHRFGDDEWLNSSTPAPLASGGFFLVVSGSGVVFDVIPAPVPDEPEQVDSAKPVDPTGDEPPARSLPFQLVERFQTSDLGSSYALPVEHEGYLYGFRGQILNCIDAQTGERQWRSRPPGGRGLLLAGDQLVVFGSGGQVVLADATPDAYLETDRLEVLTASAYTWPSFSRDRVFVRNLEQLAAVQLAYREDPASSPETADVVLAPREGTGERFGDFINRLRVSDRPDALVDRFLAEHPRLPVVEGTTAHFVYVGTGEDVAVVGSFLDDGQAESLLRVGESNLFYRSYDLSGSSRWEYGFVRDFSEAVLDPRNPHRVPSKRGWLSELRLAGFEQPAYLALAAGEPERLDSLEFEGEFMGPKRSLQVLLPRGYETNRDVRYPLLLVHEGPDWLEKGSLAAAMDALSGETVAPFVAVLIDPRDEWWLEAGGSESARYVEGLATELVPFLEERYRLRPEAASRVVMGHQHFGTTAYLAAFRHPEVFGKAAALSVGMWLGAEGQLLSAVADGAPKDLHLYLDWNRFEARSRDAGYDFKSDSEELWQELVAAGFDVAGGEVQDSYGWGGWRNRIGRILATLLPAEETP